MRWLGVVLLAAAAVAQDAKEHLRFAHEAMQMEEYEAAVKAYGRALKAAPKLVGAYLGRGRAKLALEDTEGALKDFDEAVMLEPSGAAYRLRASARQRLADYPGADKDYAKAIESDEKDLNAFYGRAQVRDLMGDHKGAIADYDAILAANPKWAPAYVSRAGAKERDGDAEGALADYGKALELDPRSVYALTNRARLHAGQGRHQEALEDLNQAIRRARYSATPYSARGRHHLDRGELERAKSDLIRAVDLDTGAATEYDRLYLCLVSLRLGEADAGRARLKKYLGRRAKKDDWYARVAGFLTGGVTEEELLAEAAKGNEWKRREHECEAYWYAGVVRLVAGDAETARAYFEKCRATGVKNFIEYASAGAALAAMGRR